MKHILFNVKYRFWKKEYSKIITKDINKRKRNFKTFLFNIPVNTLFDNDKNNIIKNLKLLYKNNKNNKKILNDLYLSITNEILFYHDTFYKPLTNDINKYIRDINNKTLINVKERLNKHIMYNIDEIKEYFKYLCDTNMNMYFYYFYINSSIILNDYYFIYDFILYANEDINNKNNRKNINEIIELYANLKENIISQTILQTVIFNEFKNMYITHFSNETTKNNNIIFRLDSYILNNDKYLENIKTDRFIEFKNKFYNKELYKRSCYSTTKLGTLTSKLYEELFYQSRKYFENTENTIHEYFKLERNIKKLHDKFISKISKNKNVEKEKLINYIVYSLNQYIKPDNPKIIHGLNNFNNEMIFKYLLETEEKIHKGYILILFNRFCSKRLDKSEPLGKEIYTIKFSLVQLIAFISNNLICISDDFNIINNI